MKSYIFNGPIELEPITKLNEFLNENPGSTVYFSSEGGDVYLLQPMLEILKQNCGELVAIGEIGSVAFKMFFLSECSKRMTSEVIGVSHSIGQRLRMTPFGNASGEDGEFFYKNLLKEKENEIKFCRWVGMNLDEIVKFKELKDVYFTNKRMHELLKHTKKSKPL